MIAPIIAGTASEPPTSMDDGKPLALSRFLKIWIFLKQYLIREKTEKQAPDRENNSDVLPLTENLVAVAASGAFLPYKLFL